MPLVEIVPGEQTTKETTFKAEQIYENIGMDVLHVRHEIEGHIADRLMEALWREALHIVNDGIATLKKSIKPSHMRQVYAMPNMDFYDFSFSWR